MRSLSKIIRYMEQYQANLPYKQRYEKTKDPEAYFRKHEMEISLCDGAAYMLRQEGLDPAEIDLDSLKSDYAEMATQKQRFTEEYSALSKDSRELEKLTEEDLGEGYECRTEKATSIVNVGMIEAQRLLHRNSFINSFTAARKKLAALLAGDENFSGKLPFTYSKHINALHTYDYKVSEHREVMEGSYNYDAVMDVQWPFGHGLSYTNFAYSDLAVDIPGADPQAPAFKAGDEIRVSVKVTNTGERAGKEAVLLYSSDLVASLIPDVKRLRGFEKIELQPGESQVVTFVVPAHELAFVGADGKWRLEEGDFRLACGGLGVQLRCTETKVWNTPNI